MPLQSNIQFAMVAPGNVPAPSNGYYAVFLADGSTSTQAGVMYRKDWTGAVTLNQSQAADFTPAKAQDAIGAALQATDTVQFVYDSGNRLISALVKAGSIATTHLTDAGVTNAKLANMAQATFKMRPASSGTGAPVDGTAVQAKAALAIAYSDVSGLGTAAQQPATAFDTAGSSAAAQAAAQAASQPLDSDLTAIAALSTTTFGRNLLTLADAAAFTSSANNATKSVHGLMSAADKTKLDNKGILGSLAAARAASTTLSPAELLSVTVPAAFAAGQPFLIRCVGNMTASGNVSFRVHAGATGGTGDAVIWTSTTSGNLSTNQRAGFDGLLTLRTTTQVQCECVGFGNTTTMPTVTAAPITGTVNSTIPWYITLSVTVSALSGYTAQQAAIEAL